MTVRALTMLNSAGDTTIAWGPEQDDAMEKIIEAKMKAGCTFWIIEPRLGGIVAPDTSKPLKKASDARKYRALSIPDADLAKFVETGAGEAIPTSEKPARGRRISRDAKEVARSESVGVRPSRGG